MNSRSFLFVFLAGVLISTLLIDCRMPVYKTPIRRTQASLPLQKLALGDLQIGPDSEEILPGFNGSTLLRRLDRDFGGVRTEVRANLRKTLDGVEVVDVRGGSGWIQAEHEFSSSAAFGYYGRGYKLNAAAIRKAAAAAGVEYIVVPVVELDAHIGNYFLSHSVYCPGQSWTTINLFVLVIDRDGVVAVSSEDFGPVGSITGKQPPRLAYDTIDMFRLDVQGQRCRVVPHDPGDFKKRLKGLPYHIAGSFQ